VAVAMLFPCEQDGILRKVSERGSDVQRMGFRSSLLAISCAIEYGSRNKIPGQAMCERAQTGACEEKGSRVTHRC
jgi:hypothetical protein